MVAMLMSALAHTGLLCLLGAVLSGVLVSQVAADRPEYHFSGLTYLNTRPELLQHYLLAAEFVNNQSDGWFDHIRLNGTMVIHTAGSGCSAIDAAVALTNHTLHYELVGVIGPMCSAASTAVARIGGLPQGGLPNISPSSTSVVLIDEVAYPYFLRTTPHDGYQTEMLTSLCTEFGWAKVAVLYALTDVYTTGIAAGFNESFPFVRGNEVLLWQSFEENSVSMLEALRNAQASGAKIILLGARVDAVQTLFHMRADYSLLFGPEYVFLGVDAWAYSGLFSTESTSFTSTALEDVATGFLGLTAYTNTSEYLHARYLGYWAQLDDDMYPDETGDRTDVDSYATQAVDAVLAYALAIEQLEHDGGDVYRGRDLWDALLDVKFNGTSGVVDFDNTGERPTDYQLLNSRASDSSGGNVTWEPIGRVVFETGEVILDKDPLFPDGTKVVVSDTWDIDVVLIGSDSSAFWTELQAHVELALRLLNDSYNGFHDLDPEQPLRSVNWILSMIDVSDCASGSGYETIEDHVDVFTNATAILGPSCSTVAVEIAEFAGSHNIPMISYSATSDTLSGLPMFARTTTPDSYQISLVSALFKLTRWKISSVIYDANDIFSTNLYDNYKLVMEEHGREILEVLNLAESDSESQILRGLQDIEASGTRVIVLLGLEEHAEEVFSAAATVKDGLLRGTEGYVWLACNGWMSASSLSTLYADQIEGALGVDVYVPPSDELSKYLEFWQDPANSYYSDRDQDGNLTGISNFGAMAVESAVLLARSVASVITTALSTSPFVGDDLYDAIISTVYDGPSGVVALDDNGDRSSMLQLQNWQSSGWVRVGTMEGTDDVDIDIDAVQWPGDEEDVPSDTIARPSESKSPVDFVGLSILCILVLLFLVVVTVLFKDISATRDESEWLDDGERGPQPRKSIVESATALYTAYKRRDSFALGLGGKGKFLPESGDSGDSVPDAMATRDSLDEADTEDERAAKAEEKRRLASATVYIYCAITGAPYEPERDIGPSTVKYLAMYYSTWWQNIIFPAICIIHMVLVIGEQSTSRTDKDAPPEHLTLLVIGVELLCCFVYISDLYVQQRLFPTATFRETKSRIYVLIVFIIVLDACIHGVASKSGRIPRFSRPLRAAVPVLHAKTMEAEMRKIARSVCHIIDIALSTVAVLVVMSGIAVVLFGPDSQSDSCKVDLDGGARADDFVTAGSAAVALFNLIPGANHPFVGYTPLDCTSYWTFVYFDVYVLFVLVLLGAMIATMVDVYIQARVEQCERLLEMEKKNLQAAFETLAERVDAEKVSTQATSSRSNPPSINIQQVDDRNRGENALPSPSDKQTTAAPHSAPDCRSGVKRIDGVAARGAAPGAVDGVGGRGHTPNASATDSVSSTSTTPISAPAPEKMPRSGDVHRQEAADVLDETSTINSGPSTPPEPVGGAARPGLAALKGMQSISRMVHAISRLTAKVAPAPTEEEDKDTSDESTVPAIGRASYTRLYLHVNRHLEGKIAEKLLRLMISKQREWLDFDGFTRFYEVLLQDVEVERDGDLSPLDYNNTTGDRLRTRLEQLLPHREVLETVTTGKVFNGISCLVVFGNIVLLLKYTAANNHRWSELNAVDDIFMGLSLLESGFRLYATGLARWAKSGLHVADAALTLIGSVLVGLTIAVTGSSVAPVAIAFRFVRVLRVLLCLERFIARALHFDANYSILSVTAGLKQAAGPLLRMVLLVFMAIYFFSTIGMELWAFRISKCSSTTCYSLVPDYPDPRTHFNTPASSMAAMFSVVVRGTADHLLAATMHLDGVAAAVYWVAAWFTFVALALNVFYSVVIEAYSLTAQARRTRACQEEEDIDVQRKRIGSTTVAFRPSAFSRRFRADLYIEERRQALQREEIVSRGMLHDIESEIQQRMERWDSVLESDLAISNAGLGSVTPVSEHTSRRSVRLSASLSSSRRYNQTPFLTSSARLDFQSSSQKGDGLNEIL